MKQRCPGLDRIAPPSALNLCTVFNYRRFAVCRGALARGGE